MSPALVGIRGRFFYNLFLFVSVWGVPSLWCTGDENPLSLADEAVPSSSG